MRPRILSPLLHLDLDIVSAAWTTWAAVRILPSFGDQHARAQPLRGRPGLTPSERPRRNPCCVGLAGRRPTSLHALVQRRSASEPHAAVAKTSTGTNDREMAVRWMFIGRLLSFPSDSSRSVSVTPPADGVRRAEILDRTGVAVGVFHRPSGLARLRTRLNGRPVETAPAPWRSQRRAPPLARFHLHHRGQRDTRRAASGPLPQAEDSESPQCAHVAGLAAGRDQRSRPAGPGRRCSPRRSSTARNSDPRSRRSAPGPENATGELIRRPCHRPRCARCTCCESTSCSVSILLTWTFPCAVPVLQQLTPGSARRQRRRRRLRQVRRPVAARRTMAHRSAGNPSSSANSCGASVASAVVQRCRSTRRISGTNSISPSGTKHTPIGFAGFRAAPHDPGHLLDDLCERRTTRLADLLADQRHDWAVFARAHSSVTWLALRPINLMKCQYLAALRASRQMLPISSA